MIRPDDLKSFFKLLFGKTQGWLCIAYINPTSRSFKEKFFQYPAELTVIADDIIKNSDDKNIYFCPQLFKSGTAGSRRKDNVSVVTCAWSDLDKCHPENLLVAPSISFESSPNRYQAFWLLDEVEPAVAEDLSRRIAYAHKKHGADLSGWDLTQLLRVPHTKNMKYKDAPEVKILTISDVEYGLEDFAEYPEVHSFSKEEVGDVPDVSNIDVDDLLEAHAISLNPMVHTYYNTVPDPGKWSHALYSLEMFLFEGGFSKEQVYAVCKKAACNKFERDKRPDSHLWRDVVSAYNHHVDNKETNVEEPEKLLTLLTEAERARVKELPDGFVERYIKWASDLSDAAKQYHQAGAFTILSALLCGHVILPTSYGSIIPNLWFMILGDTCQPLDAKVLTPTGWTTMGELSAGDKVIGRNGKTITVTATKAIHTDQVYRVMLKDGSWTEATADHLWSAKIDGYERTITTAQLAYHASRTVNVGIPIVENPVEFPERNLSVDPYILGVWIAEGSVDSKEYYACFSSGEQELVDEVQKVLPDTLRLVKYTNKWTWHIKTKAGAGFSGSAASYPNSVRDGLSKYGLLTLKSDRRLIPDDYKYGSINQRIAVLQGLLDGDGYISKEGYIEYVTTSRQLANDVQEVIQSLGGIASINEPNRLTITGKQVYRVSFTSPKGVVPFRLERKASRVKHSTKQYRGILEIVPTRTTEVRCISVDAKDQLYVTDDYIVTHNTLTRKSTSMDMAVDLLSEIDPDAVMATDGTLEGLMTILSGRPKKPSVFLRDEFSGLLDSMIRKDYMAGMPEMLTKLYDGKMMKRVLKRESFEVHDPRLIMFTGGIKTKVTQILTMEHVASGFMPRFIFITAESDITRIKPIGPPTDIDMGDRDKLLEELAKIKEHYQGFEPMKIGDQELTLAMPKEHKAVLSKEAWLRYNQLEMKLTQYGMDSEMPDAMTAVGGRLANSILKAAVLMSAARQFNAKTTVYVTEDDILRAIKYGEAWRTYADEVISNVGITGDERLIDKIEAFIRQRGTIGVNRSTLLRTFKLTARQGRELLDTMVQRNMIDQKANGRNMIYYVP